jgi:hypothetical protein
MCGYVRQIDMRRHAVLQTSKQEGLANSRSAHDGGAHQKTAPLLHRFTPIDPDVLTPHASHVGTDHHISQYFG